jgi:integrase/recombinase XerD
MLFATYGFRSAEVACLRLEQVNWDREIIAIMRPKQRRAQEYPLVPSVGEAIIRYLQSTRFAPGLVTSPWTPRIFTRKRIWR